MTVAVSWWTAASVAHAFAGGFWSFGAARAALGLGEGATFPGGLRTVVQTLPPAQRGRGLAVAYSGGSLGALVTPLIVTPIFLWWGWRGAFWFTGLIGMAWLALWAVVGGRPDIRERRHPGKAAIAPPRFRDARLWAFMAAYALGALPLGFVLYASSLYLANPLGCSQELIGRILWIPPAGWEAGYFFWGWLADRKRASFSWMMGSCAGLSLVLAAIPWMSNLAAVMAGFFLAMFVAAGFVVLSVAYATQVYSSDHAGLIAGAGAGSWSFLVAVMMPLLGRFFDLQRYEYAFCIVSAIPISGYIFWRILSRTR
jgi:ACS family hexuronate transporter-like MFS transporter